jgi:hypothetical protein
MDGGTACLDKNPASFAGFFYALDSGTMRLAW